MLSQSESLIVFPWKEALALQASSQFCLPNRFAPRKPSYLWGNQRLESAFSILKIGSSWVKVFSRLTGLLWGFWVLWVNLNSGNSILWWKLFSPGFLGVKWRGCFCHFLLRLCTPGYTSSEVLQDPSERIWKLRGPPLDKILSTGWPPLTASLSQAWHNYPCNRISELLSSVGSVYQVQDSWS